MRRVIFTALALVSLLAAPAMAAYPLCNGSSSGLCQTSPTDPTILYGCGNGDFVGSGCSTCDDACFSCTTFGQGCASLSPDDEPRKMKAAPAQREMMACMPSDGPGRG